MIPPASPGQPGGEPWDVSIAVEDVDCPDCAARLERAVRELPEVRAAEVLMGAGQLRVRQRSPGDISGAVRAAVEHAGFHVSSNVEPAVAPPALHSRGLNIGPAAAVAAIAGIVLIGESLGVTRDVERTVPRAVGAAMVFALAIPVAIRIARDTRGRRLSAHALPMMGALAALGVGEWASALLVLLLVRLASMVERDTMRRGRSALLELDALRPAIARVAHGAHEHVVPADRVPLGATVIVRPGDRVPVDGVVTAGEARLTQSAITGTDDLVHVQAGDEVFAASLAHGGALHVRATRVGGETTFGRIVEGVILAESHRPRIAATVDRFAAWYTPLIIAVALVSWAATRSVVAGASVLVIACSCSLVITVPVAMVMSIATAARSGLLVKSGRALELLARSDVLLVDKTGTVTFGEPAIDEIVAFDGTTEHDLIRLAAAAERNAEHPL
ncbi:MAG TPA: HAD-IC family P-type ATPase, partial [Gemmatimonadaceae bacterium]|nr:HAD-IC family P-type ATPase [Gemmatimonadaceae bacterium]